MTDVLHVNRSCAIPLDELEWRFDTSGGPGGQHANRSRTRAEVTFDIAASPSLSPEHRARLQERLGDLVRVAAGDERSQIRNKALALDRLRSMLAEALRVAPSRRPTKPSQSSQERRLSNKRRRSELKQSRRSLEP